ncbi:3208_t:CDS:2, partial [Scutellospora calospora]
NINVNLEAQELQELLQNNNITQELQEPLQNNSIESSISATSIESSILINATRYQYKHYQQINIKKQQAPKDHFFKQFNKRSYFPSTYNEDKSSEDEYLNLVISKKLLYSLLNMPNANYINSHLSIEVNVLKTFVAKSLQIHIEYLIAESNRESPNYTSIVLNHIKELDNITINFTFPAA